jgi:hypothetical protein
VEGRAPWPGRERPQPAAHSTGQTQRTVPPAPFLPETADLRRGLPTTRHRRHHPPGRAGGGGRSGWAPRGVTRIQRGRPAPGHRHFGSATTRTRRPHRRPATGRRPDPRRGLASRTQPSACPRCQRAAPCWTNDVDTDQRRHRIQARASRVLTASSQEGSHGRAIVVALRAAVEGVLPGSPRGLFIRATHSHLDCWVMV